MRIVLATGLFAIGVELPNAYMARHAKSLLAMIIPTMAIGWVIVAGLSISIQPLMELNLTLRTPPCPFSSTKFYILSGHLRLLNSH